MRITLGRKKHKTPIAYVIFLEKEDEARFEETVRLGRHWGRGGEESYQVRKFGAGTYRTSSPSTVFLDAPIGR